MNVLSKQKQIEAISALCEGVSIRATERLTGVDRPLFGALILLACAVLLFALVKPFDAPPNGCGQQYANPDAFKECLEIASAQSVAIYTRLLAYFTAALAVLTLVLAGASLWQAYLTRESIDEARKSSERELRAYVEVGVKLRTFSLAQPIEINVIFQNVGVTPARHVACHSHIFVLPLPLDDDTEMPVANETATGRKIKHLPSFPDVAATMIPFMNGL